MTRQSKNRSVSKEMSALSKKARSEQNKVDTRKAGQRAHKKVKRQKSVAQQHAEQVQSEKQKLQGGAKKGSPKKPASAKKSTTSKSSASLYGKPKKTLNAKESNKLLSAKPSPHKKAMTKKPIAPAVVEEVQDEPIETYPQDDRKLTSAELAKLDELYAEGAFDENVDSDTQSDEEEEDLFDKFDKGDFF